MSNQLSQPPYSAPMVGRTTQQLTGKWHAWFNLVRRYLHAELLSDVAEVPLSVADTAQQAFTVSVASVSVGDPTTVGVATTVPDGIFVGHHAISGGVRVTVWNQSGALWAPGIVTVRATAWRH